MTEQLTLEKQAKRFTGQELQLLTFRLDEQEYALNIANVVQVVRMVAITRAPHAPDFVEGMINVRGRVIPVIDLRKRLGLVAKPYDLNTQLLIARTGSRMMALIVDIVSEVLTLPASSLDFASEDDEHMTECLWAVGKRGDKLILILDLEKTLTMEQEEQLRSALAASAAPSRRR